MKLFRRGAKRSTTRTDAGHPVHRYERAVKGRRTTGDQKLVDAITTHVEEQLDAGDYMVWHQKVSAWVHVDLHVVPPSDARPHYTLVTSGMSQKPMKAPSADVAYAELVLSLPPDWPMEREDLEDERNYWPLRLLQDLAMLPHQFETWLWMGHTVPNGDPAAPYTEGTDLCCALFAPTRTVPKAFDTLQVGDREINFLGVYLLHADEMEAKLGAGFEALLKPFYDAGVTELVDVSRPSVFA